MKVYDLKDKEGRNFAFEVGNALIGRAEVARIVGRIPGAIVTRKPKAFSWSSEDEFCEWEINGVRFNAWEPFGDNSRYWIGPNPPEWRSEIQNVRNAFLQHRPFWGLFKWIPIVAGIVVSIYFVFSSKDCSPVHKTANDAVANCRPNGRNG
jgi:hypothetical protein